MISSWNLDLAGLAKELLFNAGFFIAAISLISLLPTRRTGWKRSSYFLLFLLFLVYCTKDTDKFIATPLEQVSIRLAEATKQTHCDRQYQTIVMLGGGVESRDLPSLASQERLLGLHHFLQQKSHTQIQTVILSGGTTNRGAGSEAAVYARFLELLRAGTTLPAKILLEEKSLNTYQNAAHTKALLVEKNLPLQIILLTSSLHFARATGTFQQQGFQVCAWPIPSFHKETNGLWNFQNALNMTRVLNEYLGFLGYGIRGWLTLPSDDTSQPL